LRGFGPGKNPNAGPWFKLAAGPGGRPRNLINPEATRKPPFFPRTLGGSQLPKSNSGGCLRKTTRRNSGISRWSDPEFLFPKKFRFIRSKSRLLIRIRFAAENEFLAFLSSRIQSPNHGFKLRQPFFRNEIYMVELNSEYGDGQTGQVHRFVSHSWLSSGVRRLGVFAPLVTNSWGVLGPDIRLRFLWAVAELRSCSRSQCFESPFPSAA
jgi:hypothetical protein